MNTAENQLNPEPVPYRSLSAIYAELQAKKVERKSSRKMGDRAGMACVALSVLIMAYSSLFSMVPILILYALWFPQVLVRGLVVVRPSGALFASLLLPTFACFSAFWSDYRNLTLHHALEFMSMLLCTIIMARTVSIEAFVKGVVAGTAVALLIALADGTYAQDYFSGTYSLVGLFGSKNQVGFISQIGVLASAAVFASRVRAIEKVWFSFVPCVLFALALFLSKSATAALSVFVVLGIVFLVYLVTRFPANVRMPIFVVTAVSLVLLIAVGLSMGLQEEVFAGFGKDTTLTGRTYLWNEGYKIGLTRPVVGHGYSAFWVPGQPQAERYWYEFQITGKSGFHFHELFVETFVELGLCGLAIIALLILSNVLRTIGRALRNGMTMETVFLLALSVMFMIRAFVEVDFLGPFGTGTLLFYSIIPFLAETRRK